MSVSLFGQENDQDNKPAGNSPGFNPPPMKRPNFSRPDFKTDTAEKPADAEPIRQTVPIQQEAPVQQTTPPPQAEPLQQTAPPPQAEPVRQAEPLRQTTPLTRTEPVQQTYSNTGGTAERDPMAASTPTETEEALEELKKGLTMAGNAAGSMLKTGWGVLDSKLSSLKDKLL